MKFCNCRCILDIHSLRLLICSKICISSRIFENVPQRPQKGQEYSHRNLAKARFLVTVVRIFIWGLLSSHRHAQSLS